MASLLRSNIQDFVQEVPVRQMAQGTLPWPTPPPRFQVLGGGKGEVKPPKCPTRHPRVGGYTHMSTCKYTLYVYKSYICIIYVYRYVCI